MDDTSTLPLPAGPVLAARAPQTSAGTSPAPTRSSSGTARLRRLWHGPGDDPSWARPALLGLLLATGLLYLWGLGASGWANSFYSAAVQAGSASWKAFFFGSSDAANSITVDKTPFALWPMALSVRLFGLSTWSILVPQALEGTATVALLHHLVRRTTGSAAAGLVAGAVLALTPVAVLMFRFNNPDAMLALLMVGAAAATLRAVEATRASTDGAGHPVRWLAVGGALVGFAFLTKMLQAFLVLPALALVYLLFAHTSWAKRVGHLLVAFGSMLLAGGWWVAIVELWPAASRPYIGGSQHNSVLELTLGYNGLGRLSGDETGSVGGGAGRGWGSTGILRLFDSEIGGQVAWLMPAALVLGVAALWFARSQVGIRAAIVLWGTWLLTTALTFSFMAGIFHAYYTVALVPAIAALVGVGAWVLWQHRGSLVASGIMSFTVALTSVLAWFLLDRTADFLPWLRWAVAGLGLLSALALAGAGHLNRRLALVAAGTALVASLAGPAAYAVSTASTPHAGSIPSAGPASAGTGPGARGGVPGGGPAPAIPRGTAPGAFPGGPAGGGGGMDGLLNGSTSSPAVTALLRADTAAYTWSAAAIGANNAAGYQLASQEPVMAIGGFNGSDPSPTLAQFQQYVADGQIHYFVAGTTGRGAGDGNGANEITNWITANFTSTTVGSTTLYDLSGGVR
jgi:4-amino-4-deoxy-L-arabinose transferase-like glycosyltransferase